MNTVQIFGLQTTLSLIVYALIALWYVWPRLTALPLRRQFKTVRESPSTLRLHSHPARRFAVGATAEMARQAGQVSHHTAPQPTGLCHQYLRRGLGRGNVHGAIPGWCTGGSSGRHPSRAPRIAG